MWYHTYIIENDEGYQYVGLTENLDDRLVRHNRGEIRSTQNYKSWRLVNYVSFPTRKLASDFEKYLKSGSGTSFRYRHFAPRNTITAQDTYRQKH